MLFFGLVIVAAIVLIVSYDLYLAIAKGWQATLSYWVMINSVKYPIIPAAICLVIGILIGHFWWDQELNVTVTECSK